jgi:FAD/FMN-containing dehydrogenase
MDDRRNPYLILGIPYGSPRGEARRAAARRTRELRKRQEAPYSTEDVTWSLHQVEQVIDDAASAVEVFRVPAAPGILDAPSGHGLFHPPAVPLPRRNGPLTDEDFEEIRHRAVASVSKNVLATLGPYVTCWPPDHTEGSS